MTNSALALERRDRRKPDARGRREDDQTMAALREELRRQNERLQRMERQRTRIYIGALTAIAAIGAYNLCGLLFRF